MTRKKKRQLCLICRRVLNRKNVAANLNPWICKSCMGLEEEQGTS